MTTATQGHTLETFTGRFYDYDDPQPEQVSIDDIAHALSNVCRYGGHCRTFYSVAEHCVLVSRLLSGRGGPFREDSTLPYGQPIRLAGLLHDAHEAYLGDLPTPLKHALGEEWHLLAGAADKAVAAKFGFADALFGSDAVKWADACALRLEAHRLKFSRGLRPEWDVAWQKYDLRDIDQLSWRLDFDVEAWTPGVSPDIARDSFLSAFDRLSGRC